MAWYSFLTDLPPGYQALVYISLLIIFGGLIVLALWLGGAIFKKKAPVYNTFNPVQTIQPAQVGTVNGSAGLVGQDMTPNGEFLIVQGTSLSYNGSANLTLFLRGDNTLPGAVKNSVSYSPLETVNAIPNADALSVQLKANGMQALITRATSNANAGAVRVYYRSALNQALFSNYIDIIAPLAVGGTGFGTAAYFSTNDTTGAVFIYQSAQAAAPQTNGAIFIYKNINTHIQTLVAPTPQAGDRFGAAMYIQSNTWLVTGALSVNQIYVYQNLGGASSAAGQWALSGLGFTSLSPETLPFDFWISPDGLMVLVGQPGAGGSTTNSIAQGQVEVFTRTSTSATFSSSKILSEPGGPVTNSGFGYSVTVDVTNSYVLIPGHVGLVGTPSLWYLYTLNLSNHVVNTPPLLSFNYQDFITSPATFALIGFNANLVPLTTIEGESTPPPGSYLVAANLISSNKSNVRLFQAIIKS